MGNRSFRRGLLRMTSLGRREGDKFDLVDFGLCFCMDFSFVFSMFDKYNNKAIIEDNNRLIQMKRGTQFWGEFPLGIG